MSRKPSKAIQQSGVIPYRISDGRIEVLLITTRRQQWVIPKGGIKTAMTPVDSAVQEAWEEAGVVGQVHGNVFGTYKYRKQGNTYQVMVFLLRVETVLSDWLEASTRQRQWLDVTQAVNWVKPVALKRLLQASSQQITSIHQDIQFEQTYQH